MTAVAIHYSVTASGDRVAEALVGDVAAGRELVAAARTAGAAVAWAHSAADLLSLGFREAPGFRRLTGQARSLPLPDAVTVLTASEDSAELCAAAYRGQWGHKTPDTWPIDEFAGTTALGLRSAGRIVGICRIGPVAGYIDAPGLVPGHRDVAGYRTGRLSCPLSSSGWVGQRFRVRRAFLAGCEDLGEETAGC
jgi:hypothetical protein